MAFVPRVMSVSSGGCIWPCSVRKNGHIRHWGMSLRVQALHNHRLHCAHCMLGPAGHCEHLSGHGVLATLPSNGMGSLPCRWPHSVHRRKQVG